MTKLLFLFVALVSLNVYAADDLPRFFEVVSGEIYRGAQPTDDGIKQLADMNIHTVLDLRTEKNLIAHESSVVENNGMNFISVPLNGFFAPSDRDMNQIQQILNDKTLQPVFVHCQHGQDRTGLSVGFYRVFSQGEAPQIAMQEMLDHGFHKTLLGLYFYFEAKTHGD